MAPGAYPYSLSALLARTRRDETLRRQQEDETLRCIAREHPIFYIGSVVPLLLASLFLALVVWFETERVLPNSVYAVLYVIGGLAVVGSVAYGVYRIFELWW